MRAVVHRVELVHADATDDEHARGEDRPALDHEEQRDRDRRQRREHPRGRLRALVAPLMAAGARRAHRPPKRRRRSPYSCKRLLERLPREIGPQLVAEDELRVGGLPEQVVREAPLAGGADDQVRVVHLGRVEELPEVLLVAVREAHAASTISARPP